MFIVKSLVIERHTSATPQEIEPPAKKKPASAGGRGRLFWDRATPTPCEQAANSSLAAVDREVELYFMEGEVDVDDNRLKWCAANRHRYPSIALLARRCLCIPATSVRQSESSLLRADW